MNRSAKLIAYTLFALLFPFWIFLGRLSEKVPGPVAVSIDSNNLKQIERIAVILNTPTGKISNNELDGVLKTLAASEVETQKNLTALIQQLGKQTYGTPNAGKIDVSFTPPVISVNTGGTLPPPPPRKKLNTDSIKRVLDEIEKQFEALQLQNTKDNSIPDIINVTTTEYSVLRNINLRNLCCPDKTTAINKMITTLANIASIINEEKNTDNANTNKAAIDGLQTRINKESTTYQNEIKNNCRQILYFGIKNTAGNTITILNTSFIDFEFAGINRIEGKTTGNKTLRPREVAYYKLTNACDGNITGKIYYLPVTFTKREGFLSRPVKDTLYLNIELTNN